jgi:hypothetical protein
MNGEKQRCKAQNYRNNELKFLDRTKSKLASDSYVDLQNKRCGIEHQNHFSIQFNASKISIGGSTALTWRGDEKPYGE